MSSSILEYLSRPNSLVDSTESLEGFPTKISSSTQITGMRPWKGFTYQTLMNLYGGVLQQTLPWLPDVNPPLTSLEKQVFDEDSLEHLLSRTVVPSVNYTLEHAWSVLHNENVCPQMSRGGRAKKMASEDKRFYPDWAGVHDSFRTELGFKNICPGDTKLSTRWTLAQAITGEESYSYPLQQIQNYCGESWGVRYGYLITQEELVVLRVSKQTIDPGIASTCSRRDHQLSGPYNIGNAEAQRQPQTHQRVVSDSSTSMPMSLDEPSNDGKKSRDSNSRRESSKIDSSYQPHYGSEEYNPIEFKSIPWDESGKGKLTVKLALWWLHMMAAAPGCNTSVETEYPSLHSWSTLSDGKCRHSSTGIVSNKPPLGRSTEPSTSASQRCPVAASQSAQSGFQQSLPSRPRPAPAGRESQQEPKPVEGKGKGRMR